MEKASVFIKLIRTSVVLVLLFVNSIEISAAPATSVWSIVYPQKPNSTTTEYEIKYFGDDETKPVHTYTYSYTYTRTPNLFAVLITLSLFIICCRGCCRYWCISRALRPVREGPINYHPSTVTSEAAMRGANLYPHTFTKSSPVDDLPPSYESVVGAGTAQQAK